MDTFFEKVNAAAQEVAKALEKNSICKETDVAVRVVGEYSSGKTRFIRELFGSLIPGNLEPISSQETQTRLPLEITYGEKPALEFIRRKEDWSPAEIVEKLAEFPERQKISFEPELRLRLFLPEERLILKEGDGVHEDNAPRLSRIIDYPGWNSDDEERGLASLGLSEDWRNLALVYVCSAMRIETRCNREKLRVFLEALAKGNLEQTTGKTPLFFIITYADKRESLRMAEKLQNLAREILGNKLEDFPILIWPIDFAKCTEEDLQSLRQAFWAHLAKNGIPSGCPVFPANNLEEYAQLVPYIQKCRQWLEDLTSMHGNLKKNGKYMMGREMSFFCGRDPLEVGEKAWEDWLKRVSPNLKPKAIASLVPPDLPKEHFLRPWLNAYWLPRLAEPQKRLLYFLAELRKALLDLDPEVQDLESWLEKRIGFHYRRSLISPSFAKLISLASTFPESMSNGYALCTLISLSLMESRYADHF